MTGLKEQVFGSKGYTNDLSLTAEELDIFRGLVSAQWLYNINRNYPEYTDIAKKLGIENYHLISENIDHQTIWAKINRCLDKQAREKVKSLKFIATLKQEFGDFIISDIVDSRLHKGEEEIYWRLVRPSVESDVGSPHADRWFHEVFDSGRGMYSSDLITIKIWIPLFCEPGRNGLSILEGSHLEKWAYHVEVVNGISKPVPDDDLSILNGELIKTEPGNMLIFHENTIHAGVVNRGNTTRVSAEITMILPRSRFNSIS